MQCPTCLCNLPDGTRSCPECGTNIGYGPGTAYAPGPVAAGSKGLLGEDFIRIQHPPRRHLRPHMAFSLENESGTPLGMMQIEQGFSGTFNLFMMDAVNNVLFTINSTREPGLARAYILQEPNGSELALLGTRAVKKGLMSRIPFRISVMVEGREIMAAERGQSLYEFDLTSQDGEILAHGDRKNSRKSPAWDEITIQAGKPDDRKLVLGAMFSLDMLLFDAAMLY